MATTIEARNLVKRYGLTNVVDGIHFVIQQGECYGVLGPNGAGKSSTMRMMYCGSPITEGDLFVLGLNVKDHSMEIKRQIGVVPQEDGLDTDFTVIDNLLVFGRYFSMPKAELLNKSLQLLRMMHLEDYANRSVETLSGGLKRRLAIARSLLNNPKILFLDEPTTGLDPNARYWIWETLRKLKKDGITLVLTTHYMEEAEVLCDRIAIMDHGKILSEGSPKQMVKEHVGHEIVEFNVEKGDVPYFVKKVKDKFNYQILDQKIRLFVGEGQDGKTILNDLQSDNIRVRRATLDDVFLKLAGHELRAEDVL